MSYGGQQNRTEWYDRAPLMIRQVFSQTLAPAGNTTRWTYTVPASRKCLVENAIVYILRLSAAAPADYTRASIIDGQSYLTLAQGYQQNALGWQSSGALAGSMVYLAGTVISALSWDSSTGGTQDFALSIKGTEYDA